jgi:hypothetical protein
MADNTPFLESASPATTHRFLKRLPGMRDRCRVAIHEFVRGPNLPSRYCCEPVSCERQFCRAPSGVRALDYRFHPHGALLRRSRSQPGVPREWHGDTPAILSSTSSRSSVQLTLAK